jgi:hypothetical protein
MAVFDGIEMNIVHVRSEILVVADAVLPEAPLPDAALPVTLARVRTALAHRQAAGEDRLDYPPSRREVVVAGRQRPHAVKMIGEHDPGIDGERTGSMHCSHRGSQPIDVPGQQIIAAPLQQIDREEAASSRYTVATVVGNGPVLP